MKYQCYALALILLIASLILIAACIFYSMLRLDILKMVALTCALGYGVIMSGEVMER